MDEQLLEAACRLAQKADVAVVFVGLTPQYESEGYDRSHLELPANHTALIQRVAEVNPNVVVVLSAGAPVSMPWLDQAAAVLHTYLGGQGGAGAAVDLLLGRANPGGKLAESYPLKLEDCPASEFFAYQRDQTEYRESIFVGYRYYDAAQKEVLFPFGYGLSYTKYDYDHLELSSTAIKDTDPLTVRCRIKNTGTRGGAEIVPLCGQTGVYAEAPQEVERFAKVHLALERREVEFKLGQRSFSYYNVQLRIGMWKAAPTQKSDRCLFQKISAAEAVYVKHQPPVPFDYRQSASSITGCTNRVRGFPVTFSGGVRQAFSPNRAGTLPEAPPWRIWAPLAWAG